MNTKRQELAIGLSKFLLRYGRGNELTGFITARFNDAIMAGLGLDLINRIFNLQIEIVIFTVLVVVLAPTLSYFIGMLDEKFGFWKTQNNYSTRKLNPFWQNVEERLERIENKLDDKQKQVRRTPI